MNRSDRTPEPQVDRRRFLAAGAVLTAGAAASVPRVLVAQGGTPISPVITGISPRSGAEGTLITLFGSGFDPNPLNNSVVLGTAARAEVLQASPAQLVARIGPVAATGTVGVSVIVGEGTLVPGGTVTVPPNVQAIRSSGPRLCGRLELELTDSFELTAVSPGTFVAPAVGAKIEITLTEPCESGDKFEVYLHFLFPSANPCLLVDAFAVIEVNIPGTAGFPISAEICAMCIGLSLEEAGYDVVVTGTTISISLPDALQSGTFGIVTKI